ncbi:ATP-binding protein [Pseudonocardia sp. TRM90224]|uniref:ATP-binding protein n=1 Tax=Pseudonocardia sp. TRM90224 TaxID=2812678 RepID=UPI001E36FCD3|nr:ATP-binding protein [Pseudonocardia sp. TRM90224]
MDLAERITRMTEHAEADLVLHLRSGYGSGKQSIAAACAGSWGGSLLVVDGAAVAGRVPLEYATLLGLAEREVRLQGAALYWNGFDALLGEDRQAELRMLLDVLAAHPAPAFVAGEIAWQPANPPAAITVIPVDVPAPGLDDRVRLWRSALGADTPSDLAALANAFRLTGGQIRDATATARSLAAARDPAAPEPSGEDLFAACRLQSHRRLDTVAKRSEPRFTWDDLVLPPDVMTQLREIHDQIRYRGVVHETWGFRNKLAARGN